MQDIITLHCGIDSCNTHYEYTHKEENIVAICAQWRNEESKGGDWTGLLPEQPKIGETYELLIYFALKIDLTKNFWVIYFEPYTELEGLESEQGINSMLFCLCQKKRIIDVGKHMARIDVEVVDVKKITDDNTVKADINKRTEFKEINSPSVSVEHFEHFSMISANYQSDFGWTYIIEKKNGKSSIVAENHWDFHTQIWELTNEMLTREEEEKLGIQH